MDLGGEADGVGQPVTIVLLCTISCSTPRTVTLPAAALQLLLRRDPWETNSTKATIFLQQSAEATYKDSVFLLTCPANYKVFRTSLVIQIKKCVKKELEV